MNVLEAIGNTALVRLRKGGADELSWFSSARPQAIV
jgi:hypothetical protein